MGLILRECVFVSVAGNPGFRATFGEMVCSKGWRGVFRSIVNLFGDEDEDDDEDEEYLCPRACLGLLRGTSVDCVAYVVYAPHLPSDATLC